jgi:hypothetical protein
MGVQIKLASTATDATPWVSFGKAKTAKACQSFATGTGAMTSWPTPGADLGVVELGELRQSLGPWPTGTPIVVTNVNGVQNGFIRAEVTFTAIAPPTTDCTAAVAAQKTLDAAALAAAVADAKEDTKAAAEAASVTAIRAV